MKSIPRAAGPFSSAGFFCASTALVGVFDLDLPIADASGLGELLAGAELIRQGTDVTDVDYRNGSIGLSKVDYRSGRQSVS